MINSSILLLAMAALTGVVAAVILRRFTKTWLGAAVAIPLAGLIVWQLTPLFTSTPLEFGAPALLTVKFKKALDQVPTPLLAPPPQFRVDAPPVRIPRERTIVWRLRPATAGQAVRGAADMIRMYGEVESATLTHFPMRFEFLGIRMAWGYWFGVIGGASFLASMAVGRRGSRVAAGPASSI